MKEPTTPWAVQRTGPSNVDIVRVGTTMKQTLTYDGLHWTVNGILDGPDGGRLLMFLAPIILESGRSDIYPLANAPTVVGWHTPMR